MLGPDPPDPAIILKNLVTLLKAREDLEAIGDLVGARSCCELALAVCQEAQSSDRPDIAFIMSGMGTMLKGLADLAGSQPSLKQALAKRPAWARCIPARASSACSGPSPWRGPGRW
jgi:hypothetical protein